MSMPERAVPGGISISDAINHATRSSHDKLNRLVTAYLPRALPPYVDSPALYAAGIADFGLIYETFERCWVAILDRPEPTKSHTSYIQNADWRALNYLRYLYSPDLARGFRIRHDVMNIQKQHPERLASAIATQQVAPVLQAYLNHIETAITKKPHLLIAYSWIMYMALFSGGRWIRKQLMQGGAPFWLQSLASKYQEDSVGEQFLSVLHFDGYADGVDLQRDFKRRLAEIDVLLTPQERADIVKEGIYIFQSTILLVQDLQRRYGQVSELTLAQRYSLLFSHESHFSAQFWTGFVKDPAMIWGWTKRVVVNLMLDTTIIDLDYLAKREMELASRAVVRSSTKRTNGMALLVSLFIALDVFILVAWVYARYQTVSGSALMSIII